MLADLCCKDGSLPQGSPASPCLSNIFMRDFDESVSAFCQQRKISYTRYSDEMYDADTYLSVLQGKIAFILQVTPENREFIEYRDELSSIIKQRRRFVDICSGEQSLPF